MWHYKMKGRGPDPVAAGLFKPLRAEWTSFSLVPTEFITEIETMLSLGDFTGVHARTGKTSDAVSPISGRWRMGGSPASVSISTRWPSPRRASDEPRRLHRWCCLAARYHCADGGQVGGWSRTCIPLRPATHHRGMGRAEGYAGLRRDQVRYVRLYAQGSCCCRRLGLPRFRRSLERSPPHWIPVRRKRARQNENLEP